MKCDDRLYCWLLDWREEMQRRHDLQLTHSDPMENTLFSDFVKQVNQQLARVDKPD